MHSDQGRHLPHDVSPRTFWFLLIVAWAAIIALCAIAAPALGAVALAVCLGAMYVGRRVA